jgi:hypothetical protein
LPLFFVFSWLISSFTPQSILKFRLHHKCWMYLESIVLFFLTPWSCTPAFKYPQHTSSTYLYLNQRFWHLAPPIYIKHHFDWHHTRLPWRCPA